MKKKLFCIFVLCIAFFHFSHSEKFAAADELPQINKQLVSVSAQRKLTIIRSITAVKRGDVGIITIQGMPGVKYTIESSFIVGNRIIPATQWRIGDSKGQATFNWVVGGDTVPGTYTIKIYGGGEVLSLFHTVLP